MEGTGENDSAAALEAAEHGASVTARVDKGVEFAIAIPRNKDRLTAYIGCKVVVLVRDLAFVREVDPVALEDIFHLQLEDLRVGEYISGNPITALFDVVFYCSFEPLADRLAFI